MKNIRSIILISAASAALAGTGCRPMGEAVGSATRTVVTGHPGGAYTAKNSDQYNVENQAQVVLMDYRVQRSVTYNSLKATRMSDGRLEVAANLRNRLNRRIQVEVQCVFKDENGFSTGDETPWMTQILTESAQETVQFASMNEKASKFTIRVREAH